MKTTHGALSCAWHLAAGSETITIIADLITVLAFRAVWRLRASVVPLPIPPLLYFSSPTVGAGEGEDGSGYQG